MTNPPGGYPPNQPSPGQGGQPPYGQGAQPPYGQGAQPPYGQGTPSYGAGSPSYGQSSPAYGGAPQPPTPANPAQGPGFGPSGPAGQLAGSGQPSAPGQQPYGPPGHPPQGLRPQGPAQAGYGPAGTGPQGTALQGGPPFTPAGGQPPGGFGGQYPAGGLPPAPPQKQGGLGTGAKVGIGVSVLALIAGGAFVATQVAKPKQTVAMPPSVTVASPTRPTAPASSAKPSSAQPSASSSGSKGPKRTDAATAAADGTITGPGFTAKLPSGWKISDNNGFKDRALEITDKNNNLITLFDEDTGDITEVCKDWVAAVQNDPDDKVETLPAGTWGGLPSASMKVTTHNDDASEDEIFTFTCAKKGTRVYTLAAVTWVEDEASVKSAADAVKASWQWK